MSEIVAILSVAFLAVVFGLLQRRRGGCPGPEACDTSSVDDPGGCASCSFTSESNHVRT
ncbi:MAG: hypothetical protein ACYS0K_10495 [Planctomycetota bacterium]|jgi:hypothetical protein